MFQRIQLFPVNNNKEVRVMVTYASGSTIDVTLPMPEHAPFVLEIPAPPGEASYLQISLDLITLPAPDSE